MKRMVTTLLVLSMFAFAAYGQWGWTGGLGTDDADTTDAYGQGLAVDGAGKIWYTPYYNSQTVLIDTGSGTADYEDGIRAIYVFNPDGTPASFSPITEITVDGKTDTLQNSSRGLETDPDGNIVHCTYWEMYRINHTTGEGMAHLMPEDSSSLCKVAFTSAGEMLVNFVLPGMGLELYDTDWTHLGEIVPGEMTNSYARTCEIAPDGSYAIYNGFTSGIGLVVFNSDTDDIYGDYTGEIDTVALGLSVESTQWGPDGKLWVGNTGGAGWTNAAHYALDPANNWAVVDSMILPASEVDLGIKPRGLDFSPDGMTAYVNFFNSWDSDPIYKFEKGATGVWEHTGSFIVGYSLKAAYPNPFNPSTKLDVTMKEAGVADLRIYDIRGAEVAVLNNNYMSAGEHTFTFNGSNLSAGVYIAKLTVNGAMYTQSMTLVK